MNIQRMEKGEASTSEEDVDGGKGPSIVLTVKGKNADTELKATTPPADTKEKEKEKEKESEAEKPKTIDPETGSTGSQSDEGSLSAAARSN
jgi:hypothetical protein